MAEITRQNPEKAFTLLSELAFGSKYGRSHISGYLNGLAWNGDWPGVYRDLLNVPEGEKGFDFIQKSDADSLVAVRWLEQDAPAAMDWYLKERAALAEEKQKTSAFRSFIYATVSANRGDIVTWMNDNLGLVEDHQNFAVSLAKFSILHSPDGSTAQLIKFVGEEQIRREVVTSAITRKVNGQENLRHPPELLEPLIRNTGLSVESEKELLKVVAETEYHPPEQR